MSELIKRLTEEAENCTTYNVEMAKVSADDLRGVLEVIRQQCEAIARLRGEQ